MKQELIPETEAKKINSYNFTSRNREKLTDNFGKMNK